MRISGNLNNLTFKVKILEPNTDPYPTYRLNQYELRDAVFRVYRTRPDKTKRKWWEKYLDQSYTLLTINQNNTWFDLAKTATYDVNCMHNSSVLLETHIPCLYENAGNQYLGLVNLKSGKVDPAVFLDKDNNGYSILGKQGKFILVRKDISKLLAINLEEKIIYNLLMPKSLKLFNNVIWNGQFIALTDDNNGIHLLKMTIIDQ